MAPSAPCAAKWAMRRPGTRRLGAFQAGQFLSFVATPRFQYLVPAFFKLFVGLVVGLPRSVGFSLVLRVNSCRRKEEFELAVLFFSHRV